MINIKEYNDYIKIFIIRNPVFVFSSMNKRFDTDKIPRSHSIEAYKKTISKFIEYSKLNIPNLYLIKYEDMFNNKYELLKNIFNDIGFKYTDDIFDNTKYKNEVQFNNKKINIPIVKPDDKEHTLLRLYQINKPFVNNNNKSNIKLTDMQKKEILSSEEFLSMYPNINNLI